MLLKEVRVSYEKYLPETDFSLPFAQEYPYRRLYKRSIDSRGKGIHFVLKYQCSTEPFAEDLFKKWCFKPVHNAPQQVHIIGAGPAGYFAALQALVAGIKPIIYERGKEVKERRHDLAKLIKNHVVNHNSNYCFGEGGAGTYSDGKLYTRSKKRGDVHAVLSALVQFGADKDILIDAHPHIGTNKLPGIIEQIRACILEHGGDIHFSTSLTNFFTKNDRIEAIEINHEQNVNVGTLILATGHSARDVFELLHKHKVSLSFKPFAMGFRIEHPQEWVNNKQYHGINHSNLPPAAYSLVTQTKDRGVFSFCMCPGGIIAPCATDTSEIVTNGWSPSKRNNAYANSGLVAEVSAKDLDHPNDPMAGLLLQQQIEKKAWEMAGKTQAAPAQKARDYINNIKGEITETSYLPGIKAVNLNHLFPPKINGALRQALIDFDKKMPGYIDNAMLVAPETRTSSPIQIARDRKTLTSLSHNNLYPCAEGAGYAGGIVSAAIDGMRCVLALVNGKMAE